MPKQLGRDAMNEQHNFHLASSSTVDRQHSPARLTRRRSVSSTTAIRSETFRFRSVRFLSILGNTLLRFRTIVHPLDRCQAPMARPDAGRLMYELLNDQGCRWE